MAFVDLNSIHNPATGASPPATFGDQVRDNFQYLHERGPYICTSATRPGAPFEGQQIYETDTDTVLIYSGTAWITAGSFGAWTTWTPTAIGAVVFTYAKYRRVWGRGIEFRLKITWDASPTSVVSEIQVTPPVAPHADYGLYAPCGAAMAVNTGVSAFNGTCVFNGSGNLCMFRDSALVTGSSLFTFNNLDLFMLQGSYEPAAAS